LAVAHAAGLWPAALVVFSFAILGENCAQLATAAAAQNRSGIIERRNFYLLLSSIRYP
jgi:hypothetical protein